MKRNIIWSLIPLLLLATAGSARAVKVGDASAPVATLDTEELTQVRRHIEDFVRLLPKQEVGVHVFYQDVHALTPGGTGTPVYGYGGAVIGLGGQFTIRPNPNSGLFLRGMGGYGVGSEKVDVTGTFPFTDKVTFKSIYGSAGLGAVVPITTRAGVYAQGGAFYSTTKGTFDSGPGKEDGEAFKVFGVDSAVGLRYSIGGKNSVFFEQYSQYGWGSGEQDGSKYNETVKYGCFRGGLNFGL